MPSKPFDYTVSSQKPFDEAVASIQAKTAEKGFNAKYASEVLKRDVKISLMLPCPIGIYTQSGQTFISALLPGAIAEFYPEAGIEAIALQVEQAVREIVDEAR